MNINKHNYEAFFLDYIEGSLSTEITAELLLFLEANPTLKKELEEFELIEIDSNIETLNNKEELKKHINKENVENYIIGSVEKLNTETDELELMTFVDKNPESSLLLRRYQKTILPIPQIVFSNKYKLKKRSRVIVLYPLIGVAASILFFFLLSSNPTEQKYKPQAMVFIDTTLSSIEETNNLVKIDSNVELEKNNGNETIAVLPPKKKTDTEEPTLPQNNIVLVNEDTLENKLTPIEIEIPPVFIASTDSSTINMNDSTNLTFKNKEALTLNEWANQKVRTKIFNQETSDSSKIKKEEVFDALANRLNKISKQEIAYNQSANESAVTQGFSIGNFEFSRTKRIKIKS